MSMYYCCECDKQHDDDQVMGVDVGGEIICEDLAFQCETCKEWQNLGEAVDEEEEMCKSCLDKLEQELTYEREAKEAALEDLNDDKRRGM